MSFFTHHVWTDPYLVQNQLCACFPVDTLLSILCVNRSLYRLASHPSVWKEREVELFIAPENAKHRLTSKLPLSPLRHGRLVLTFDDQSDPEGEVVQLESAPRERRLLEWPTMESIMPIFLQTPNVIGWDLNRGIIGKNVTSLNWYDLLSNPRMQHFEVLQIPMQFTVTKEISLRSFTLLPPSLQLLSLREGHQETPAIGLNIEILSTIVDALPHLQSFEISVQKEPLTAQHWRLLAKLPKLKRFGLQITVGTLSFQTLVQQIREAQFGINLEVFELDADFSDLRGVSTAELTERGPSHSVPEVFPQLRLLSIVFAKTSAHHPSLIEASPIVFSSPRLQTVFLSTSYFYAPILLKPALEAIAYYDKTRSFELAPLHIHLLAQPRAYLYGHNTARLLDSTIAELRQNIPVELSHRIQVRTYLPSELYRSSCY